MSREINLFKNTCNRCFLSYLHIILIVLKVMKHDSVALMCESTFSLIHKETPLCLCRYLFYGRKYKSLRWSLKVKANLIETLFLSKSKKSISEFTHLLSSMPQFILHVF